MNRKVAKASEGISGNEMSSSNKSNTSNTNLDSIQSPITFSKPLTSRKDSSIQEYCDLYKQTSLFSRTCECSLEPLEYEKLESIFTLEDSDNIENFPLTSLCPHFKQDLFRLYSVVYKNQPALIRPVIFNESRQELEYTCPP